MSRLSGIETEHTGVQRVGGLKLPVMEWEAR